MDFISNKKIYPFEGLGVYYDGKMNIAVSGRLQKKYRIGEMICEFTRNNQLDRKDVLCHNPYAELNISTNNTYRAWQWMEKNMIDSDDLIVTTMLLKIIRSFMVQVDGKVSHFLADRSLKTKFQESPEHREIAFEIFGKNFDGNFVINNIKDMLQCGYYIFLLNQLSVKRKFKKILEGSSVKPGIWLSEDNDIESSASNDDIFLGVFDDISSIDFQIIYEDGKFLPAYDIHTSTDLLLFEAAHIQEKGIKVAQCKNCHSFFIPKNRSDTIYCDNPSPQDPARTCKKIGAQITRISMEKQYAGIRQYRKIYLANNMRMKRHPDNNDFKRFHDEMVQGAKDWRRKLRDNPGLYPEYERWVESLSDSIK